MLSKAVEAPNETIFIEQLNFIF